MELQPRCKDNSVLFSARQGHSSSQWVSFNRQHFSDNFCNLKIMSVMMLSTSVYYHTNINSDFGPTVLSNNILVVGMLVPPMDRCCIWCRIIHCINTLIVSLSPNGAPVFHNDNACIVEQLLLASFSTEANLLDNLIFLKWMCFTELGSSSSSVTWTRDCSDERSSIDTPHCSLGVYTTKGILISPSRSQIIEKSSQNTPVN